jgi:hypothetical protein
MVWNSPSAARAAHHVARQEEREQHRGGEKDQRVLGELLLVGLDRQGNKKARLTPG